MSIYPPTGQKRGNALQLKLAREPMSFLQKSYLTFKNERKKSDEIARDLFQLHAHLGVSRWKRNKEARMKD